MATYSLTEGIPTFMEESWANSSSITINSHMTATYDGECITLTNNESSNGGAWINNTPFPSTVSGNTSDTAQILYICAEAKGYSTNTVGHPRMWYRTYINGSTTLTNYAMRTLDGEMDAPNDDKWHTFSVRITTYDNGSYYEYTGVSPVLYTSNGVGDKASFKNLRVYNLTKLYGRGNEPTKVWCDKNLTTKGTITNLVTARTATFTNMEAPSKGVFTFKAGDLALTQTTMATPVYGHKYYGRCYQKAPAGHTWNDARFEYYAEDIAGTGLMTFGFMEPTNNEWKMLSSIQTLTGTPSTKTWYLRSFVSGGNADSYRKEIVIVDLTDTFGAGNEPTKEWCDKNIPFFEGELTLIPGLKEGDVINCPYSGSRKGVALPIGVYTLEAWGGQGGTSTQLNAEGGQGGYSTGLLKAKKPLGLITYAGGQGSSHATTTYTSVGGGGFNGGGNAGYKGGGGGGASDFRIGYDSLYARALVAGGGGGAHAATTTYKAAGGVGGGEKGADGSYYNSSYTAFTGKAASQTSGGAGGTGTSANYNGKAGTFGQGGNTGYKYNSTSYHSNGAGGGGWYGGGGAGNYSSGSHTRSAGGGGGSGYIYTKGLSRYYPAECLLEDNYLEEGSTNFWSRGMFSTLQGEIYPLKGNQGNGACRITIERLGNTDETVLLGNNVEQTLNLGNDLIEKAYLGDEQIFPVIEFVDYIEACGHQYINTEIKPTTKTTFEISVDINPQKVKTDTCLFGSRSGSTDQFVLWDGHNTDDVSHRSIPAIGSLSSDYYYSPTSTKNIFKYDGTAFYCNDVKIFTISNTAGANDYPIYLFALNNAGAADTRMYEGKVYYFKIWQDGVLVRDFKPAKTKDGTYGMYDLVSKRMFLNENFGNFYTKNLLQNATLESGGIANITATTPGIEITSSTDVRLADYLEVEPNTVYGFARNEGWTVSGASIGCFWYDENKNYIGKHSATSAYDAKFAFIYSPYNAKYFKFTDSHNSTSATYIMYKLYQRKNQEYETKLQVTRSVLDTGTFSNVTPTYLTGQINNSAGFTITGRNAGASGSATFSGNLRWNYTIDLTNYDAVSFYCKKGANHGICAVTIDEKNICYVHYNDLATNYTPYLLNLEKYSGTHTISFIGGYTDNTGSTSSATTYCDIKFLKKK